MFEIPLTETTLDEEEVQAAVTVLRSTWLTMGREVAAFEVEFAAAMDARHAIAVSSGTAALEICFAALGMKAGDEAVIPAITFVACLNALRRLGVRVILADVTSEDDLTMSVEDFQRKSSAKTRLVVPMPHGGFCPNMPEIKMIAGARSIEIIEDACHAPLAVLNGRKIGSFGRAGCWSFFGNKNMTTGEGGMITTDDDAFAEKCRLMRSHGITRPTWDRAQGHASSYDVALAGTNARLDEIRAAIGRVQLRKLPEATEARTRVAGMLRDAIEAAGIDGLKIPYGNHPGKSAHHLFCVLLPKGRNRTTVMERMKGEGIQTSIHYPPLYSFSGMQQYFLSEGSADELPVTDAVSPRLLTLPLSPKMTEEQVQRIAKALKHSVKN